MLVGRSLAGLGPGATVATGSPRRRALLLERRPDLTSCHCAATWRAASPPRGATASTRSSRRWRPLSDLAKHGLVRERLDPTWFVPQVGQGAIALEAASRRRRDARGACAPSTMPRVHARSLAERAFLRELGAGCSIPAAPTPWSADDVIDNPRCHARARRDQERPRGACVGSRTRVELGVDLARRLRDELGGGELLGWET